MKLIAFHLFNCFVEGVGNLHMLAVHHSSGHIADEEFGVGDGLNGG